jgi:site-specific DNA-methyltransferase (adenine-specific)
MHQPLLLPCPPPHRFVREGKVELDQYNTPAFAAEAIVRQRFGDLGADDRVIDFGTGATGVFLRAIPEGVPAIGVEIDPESAALAAANTGRPVICGDFRTVELPFQPTVILGNPPFTRAIVDEALRRASLILPDNGRCGFLLPSTYICFASSLDKWRDHFSVQQDAVPKNLFPRIRDPLSFYLFTKEKVRHYYGFLLFDECSEVYSLKPKVRLALMQGGGKRGAWAHVVDTTMRSLGGRATLEDLYEAIQAKKPRGISTWKATVRRWVQDLDYRNVGPGEWAIPEAA